MGKVGGAGVPNTMPNVTGVNEDLAIDKPQQAPEQVVDVRQEPRKMEGKGSSALRSDLALQGSILQAQVQGQLPTGIADIQKGAEKILDSKMNPEQKVAQLQKFLEGKNLSGADIQQLLSNLSGRKQGDQELTGYALAKSRKIMETIRKELAESDQVKLLNQIFDATKTRQDGNLIQGDAFSRIDQDVSKNLGEWARHISPETLNRAFDDKTQLGNQLQLIAQDPSNGLKFAFKLNDHNASSVIDSILHVSPIPEEQGLLLSGLFRRLGPEAKNKMFDAIQDNGDMPKFLESQAKYLSKESLDGLSKENLNFMQTTYEQLAKAAEMKKETKALILYQEKILHLKGYLENHFR